MNPARDKNVLDNNNNIVAWHGPPSNPYDDFHSLSNIS